MVKEINTGELAARIENGDEVELLDIRSDAELMQGVLPNAKHLPMHLIPLKINDFPKDKDIILYCRSGARSYQAVAYLAQQGFDNIYNLSGGIISWAQQGKQITAYQ